VGLNACNVQTCDHVKTSLTGYNKFPPAASMAWALRILVYCVLTVMSECKIPFVDIYLCSVSTFLGVCAARIYATQSFSCSSWQFRFLSSRHFARGQS
jgi:hypothetical protein